MPLHISLDVGLKVLNTIEEAAIAIDKDIKALNGQQTTEINEIMENLKLVSSEILEKTEKPDDQIEDKNTTVKKVEIQDSSTLRKIDSGESYCEKTVQARRIQQQYKEHIKEIKDIEKEKKLLEKELQVTQASYENLKKDFNEKRGNFQPKFCNVMDNMKLQRQVYHSGALVCNGVDKLTKNENISNISTVFKPLLIKLSDDSGKEFSSRENVVKMRTLLTKFKQCYDIYSVSRALCRHEASLRSIRCSSMGCWFPVNFPVVSIIPKFHVLTYHIPEKARSRITVEMEGEHSSESIHTVVNLLNRAYYAVQNVTIRLELVFKAQSLRNNRTLKISENQ